MILTPLQKLPKNVGDRPIWSHLPEARLNGRYFYNCAIPGLFFFIFVLPTANFLVYVLAKCMGT